MLNFGASKPRVKGGGPGPRGPPLDPHLRHSLKYWVDDCDFDKIFCN